MLSTLRLIQYHAKKRPRYDLDEIDRKMEWPTISKMKDGSYENVLKPPSPPFPNRLIGIMEPDEFTGLVDNPNHEIGDLIPINSEMEGENGMSQSFMAVWFYVSYETSESLGLSKDELSKFHPQTNKVVRVERKKYEKVSSIRYLPSRKSAKDEGCSSEQVFSKRKEGCWSENTELEFNGAHKIAPNSSSSSSCSSHSESVRSDASTTPPSSSEPELMEFDCQLQELDGGLFSDAGVQTTYLDPLLCVYCQSKKGESERIYSLRQKKSTTKDNNNVIVNGQSKTLNEANGKAEANDGEDEEDDLVPIEYEIEKILDYRKQDGTNVDEYFIRWKNYTSDYDTWEPDSNLNSCDKALITFYANRAVDRRNSEKKLTKQGNNGALVPLGNGNGSGRKKVQLPSLPPMPEILWDVLTRVIPISDGEIEIAFKRIKTMKKKDMWTKTKLLKTMLDIIGDNSSGSSVSEKALSHHELPQLRHQVLMIEAERRKDLSHRDLKVKV